MQPKNREAMTKLKACGEMDEDVAFAATMMTDAYVPQAEETDLDKIDMNVPEGDKIRIYHTHSADGLDNIVSKQTRNICRLCGFCKPPYIARGGEQRSSRPFLLPPLEQ